MDLLREAGLAARRLGRAPGYTTAAAASLAIAIGSASALFSVIHAVVLRPLPIREPGRLVTCWETNPQHNLAVVEVSFRNFLDWQAQNRAFTGMAALGASNWSRVLEGRGDPVRLAYTAVTASFFDVLGASAALGRTFTPDDDRPGAPPVVVLSHGIWERRFGADAGVVGQVLTLDRRPYTVVGVMPRGFEYPRGAEFWTPLVPVLEESSAEWRMDALESRGLGLLYVLGRLKPGVSEAMGAQDLERVVADVWRAAPMARPAGHGVVITPFFDQFFGPVRRVLLWLFAAVGLVLLIGCANVSGLMLTRATERRRSDAVRQALGAGRRRLTAAWVLEAGWLVLLGGLAGLLGAAGLTRLIVALAPADIPRLADVAVDGSVVAFTLVVCAVATLACALGPAWRSASADIVPALAESGRSTQAHSSLRTRTALVVAEIALAVAILVAGGLLVRSFRNLRQLDLGYEPTDVLVLHVDPQEVAASAFYAELVARIEALPDVVAVGAVYLRPMALGPIGQEMSVVLEGQDDTVETALRNPYINYESATPGYFRAMRIPLVRGRLFDERDDARAPKVAILGESAARRFWPDQDPIGRRLATPDLTSAGTRSVWHTVVGVVRDARYRGLDDVRLDLYEPSDQAPPEYMARQLVVRTAGEPLDIAAAVQALARSLDDGAVVGSVTTMDAIVGRAIAPWRFAVWTFVMFALVAFLLATGGLASLVGLTVALRAREFAVRTALGAQGRQIAGRVLRDAAKNGLLGVSLGLGIAAAGTRWLESLLFEVQPLDPATYGVVVAIVLATTVAASLVPARRARRVDLVHLLREE
jgi:putative ABC transport system permease protein